MQICCLCWYAEKLQKAVNCLKESQESENNVDVLNVLISSLGCEGNTVIVHIAVHDCDTGYYICITQLIQSMTAMCI